MDVLTFNCVVGVTLAVVILILLHPVWLTRFLGRFYSDRGGAYATVDGSDDDDASDEEAINTYLDEVYGGGERGGYQHRRAIARRGRTLRRNAPRGLRVLRGLRPGPIEGALRPAPPTPPPPGAARRRRASPPGATAAALQLSVVMFCCLAVVTAATTMRPSFRADCDLPIYDGRAFRSMEDFEVLVQARGNVPSILAGLMDDWPALREWNGTDPGGVGDPFVARYGDSLRLPIRDLDRVSSQGGYCDGEFGGGADNSTDAGDRSGNDDRRRAGVSTLREYAYSAGGAHGGGRLVFDVSKSYGIVSLLAQDFSIPGLLTTSMKDPIFSISRTGRRAGDDDSADQQGRRGGLAFHMHQEAWLGLVTGLKTWPVEFLQSTFQLERSTFTQPRPGRSCLRIALRFFDRYFFHPHAGSGLIPRGLIRGRATIAEAEARLAAFHRTFALDDDGGKDGGTGRGTTWLRCTQMAGEIVYQPANAPHATYNGPPPRASTPGFDAIAAYSAPPPFLTIALGGLGHTTPVAAAAAVDNVEALEALAAEDPHAIVDAVEPPNEEKKEETAVAVVADGGIEARKTTKKKEYSIDPAITAASAAVETLEFLVDYAATHLIDRGARAAGSARQRARRRAAAVRKVVDPQPHKGYQLFSDVAFEGASGAKWDWMLRNAGAGEVDKTSRTGCRPLHEAVSRCAGCGPAAAQRGRGPGERARLLRRAQGPREHVQDARAGPGDGR